METEKRKPGREKKDDAETKKARQIYATDAQWNKIKELAKEEKLDVSPFAIKKLLS